ncbi:hypothetical protein DXC04_04480 [Dorea sp. OM07-5]|uniref:hypothetical protein n=1 Tax=Dorea sp. OM07-5 TaxID=2293100 RepID=UPI000E424939|nr:hypothetical protein [Dorea sp. OM07-5]RGF23520.1 hypothetical protein DW125_07410 [Dorea sp. AM10-31]RHU97603.1 hypothetical protein DXC04_04480 [Dorea sp. OM07-5]
MEIHFCTFSSCFDYYAYFNTLIQFAGAVGTSVCAALVAAAQMQNNSFSHEQKTAAKECNMPLSTFRYRAEISKKLDYCKVGILHESVLFDKRFLLL